MHIRVGAAKPVANINSWPVINSSPKNPRKHILCIGMTNIIFGTLPIFSPPFGCRISEKLQYFFVLKYTIARRRRKFWGFKICFAQFLHFWSNLNWLFRFRIYMIFSTAALPKEPPPSHPCPGWIWANTPGGINDEELMESPAVPNQLAGIPEHKH